MNDVEGIFLINLQARGGADLDALKARVLDHVAELGTPKGLSNGDLRRLRASFAQLTMTDLDVNKIPVPAGMTRTMMQANVELQRMAKSLAWGDLDAYRRRLDRQKLDDVRRAIRKHLAPESASIVRVQNVEREQ